MNPTARRAAETVVQPLVWMLLGYEALVRAYHYLHAKRQGYFWRPCACCLQPFGGHQWDPGRVVVRNGEAGPRLEPVCSRDGCNALYHSRALKQMTREERAQVRRDYPDRPRDRFDEPVATQRK